MAPSIISNVVFSCCNTHQAEVRHVPNNNIIVITCVIYVKGILYCKILKFFNVICLLVVICEHVLFMCLTLLVSIVSVP